MVERVDPNALALGGCPLSPGHASPPKIVPALRAVARKQGKTLSEVAEERLVT